MASDGADGVSVGWQSEVPGVFPSGGYAEIVQGTGGDRPFRDGPPAQPGRCVCVCREEPQDAQTPSSGGSRFDIIHEKAGWRVLSKDRG